MARQAMDAAVRKEPIPPLDLTSLPPELQQQGASFVTLTVNGGLRGCIGALEAYQPLALDVREHAQAAALNDYRFPPVTPPELSAIDIEISYLTQPVPLDYADAADLMAKLRPGVDGVVLGDNFRKATFLPQVWEKLPAPEDFLDQLCYKMGAAHDVWRRRKLSVQIYQVEEFHERP